MKRASSQYWFPILIPAFIGMLLPLLGLHSNFSRSETIAEFAEIMGLEHPHITGFEEITEISFKNDLRKFVPQAVQGVVVSLISVYIWAITILLTTRYPTHQSNPALLRPIIALFLHICLGSGLITRK